MSRKVEAIDLFKLWSAGSVVGWNQELQKLYQRNDVAGLARLLYAIQAGMDDVRKSGLNTDKMNTFFLRLQHSIEKTLKAILRKKYPNPLDDPMNARDPRIVAEWQEIKRKRDQEFAEFMRKSSY